jgi:hypothetical protein
MKNLKLREDNNKKEAEKSASFLFLGNYK